MSQNAGPFWLKIEGSHGVLACPTNTSTWYHDGQLPGAGGHHNGRDETGHHPGQGNTNPGNDSPFAHRAKEAERAEESIRTALFDEMEKTVLDPTRPTVTMAREKHLIVTRVLDSLEVRPSPTRREGTRPHPMGHGNMPYDEGIPRATLNMETSLQDSAEATEACPHASNPPPTTSGNEVPTVQPSHRGGLVTRAQPRWGRHISADGLRTIHAD